MSSRTYKLGVSLVALVIALLTDLQVADLGTFDRVTFVFDAVDDRSAQR